MILSDLSVIFSQSLHEFFFVPGTFLALNFRFILNFLYFLLGDTYPLPPEEAWSASRCNLVILTFSCRPLVILLSFSVITFPTLFRVLPNLYITIDAVKENIVVLPCFPCPR